MTEWQPIETAPRDGTPILMWGKRAQRCWVVVPHVEYDDPDPTEGLTWQEHGGGMYGIRGTHWMPLPEPPQ